MYFPILYAISIWVLATACNKPQPLNPESAKAAETPVDSEGPISGDGPNSMESSDPASDNGEVPSNPIITDPVPPPAPPLPPGPLSAEERCKLFNWEKITKPEDVDCFKSVDSVFASLPDWVKPYFILMRKTQSAQLASLEKPRVIVVSPEGTFIVAAATDPKSRPELEVAVYDYKMNAWNYAGIDFSTSPPKIEKELCKKCHGADPHPIWTGYNRWPGAFGETPFLSAEEAAFLKNAASGKGDVPSLLKHLKYQPAARYVAGQIFRPAVRGVDNENNQIINFVAATKSARSLTAKILNDRKVTKADLNNILKDGLCRANGGTLAKIGYPENKHLSHSLEIEGKAGGVNWVGFANGTTYFAIALLQKMMATDPALKAKLPAVVAQFENPKFRIFSSSGPADFLSTYRLNGYGWYPFDFDVLSPLMRNHFNPGTATCRTLLAL